jgi:hypothetical protein
MVGSMEIQEVYAFREARNEASLTPFVRILESFGFTDELGLCIDGGATNQTGARIVFQDGTAPAIPYRIRSRWAADGATARAGRARCKTGDAGQHHGPRSARLAPAKGPAPDVDAQVREASRVGIRPRLRRGGTHRADLPVLLAARPNGRTSRALFTRLAASTPEVSLPRIVLIMSWLRLRVRTFSVIASRIIFRACASLGGIR